MPSNLNNGEFFYIRTAVTGCHAQGKEFFAISRIKQGNIWHNWK
jgi:hypothetical protein